MRPTKRRVETRDKDQPAAGGNDALEGELDKLALQIVRRASKADDQGNPTEPLPVQLNALKIAGAYFGLKKKHTPVEEDEGSGWGDLLMGAAPKLGFDEEEEETEEIDG